MELYEDIKERTDLCEMAREGLRTEYLRHLQLLGTTIDKEVRLIMSHRDDEIQQLRNRVLELEEANKLLEADKKLLDDIQAINDKEVVIKNCVRQSIREAIATHLEMENKNDNS